MLTIIMMFVIIVEIITTQKTICRQSAARLTGTSNVLTVRWCANHVYQEDAIADDDGGDDDDYCSENGDDPVKHLATLLSAC